MIRRMLINAQSSEELRIAIATDSTLDNYQVEVSDTNLTRSNIYRGVVANVQPSLNAAFIDYGAARHGFLAIQDLVAEACHHDPPEGGRWRIEDLVERGKPLLVQVTKEPEGNKGAALTTSLSLAGRYLVFTPFDSTRGVSRKVEDEETRHNLKDLISKLEMPPGGGVIARTNALEQSKITLGRDMSALLRLWKRIEGEGKKGKHPKLLYSDQDLILRALRDYLDASIEEILVDDDEAFATAEEYLKAFLPRGKARLIRYTERTPLFSRFDLEGQIETIYERVVSLPSGGSIVVDRTEALTAIDVNSGRATRAATQEETAVATNLEAADEVARQLVLRDLGGLVVVDFIDMKSSKHRRKVEKAVKDAMKADKARSSVGRISANGLLEINRQRIQQALSLRTHRACPTCGGTGRIASPEMVGLSLLRRIQARAAGGKVSRVRIALHPELADHLQNTRRRELTELEGEFEMEIEIIASPGLHRPQQDIEWTERSAEEAAARRARAEQARAAEAKAAKPVVSAADLTFEPEEEEEPEATENGEGSREGKRKKRRRGGRKRRGKERPAGELQAASSQAGEAASPAREPESEDDDEGNEEASAGADGSPDTESTPGAKAKRRRRRGGRRRRRGKDGASQPGAEPVGDGGGVGEGGGDDDERAGADEPPFPGL